jgi:hypothetical protein
MTKEELESKFDDCFDANTRASEGGYGADTTDRQMLWEHFYPIVKEHAKQQAIEFNTYLSHNQSEEIRTFLQHVYNQFIEQQNKP